MACPASHGDRGIFMVTVADLHCLNLQAAPVPQLPYSPVLSTGQKGKVALSKTIRCT